MTKQNEKGRKWDGRSRISTEKYKQNWNEIFSDHSAVKHERNRHRKDSPTTHRELPRNS